MKIKSVALANEPERRLLTEGADRSIGTLDQVPSSLRLEPELDDGVHVAGGTTLTSDNTELCRVKVLSTVNKVGVIQNVDRR